MDEATTGSATGPELTPRDLAEAVEGLIEILDGLKQTADQLIVVTTTAADEALAGRQASERSNRRTLITAIVGALFALIVGGTLIVNTTVSRQNTKVIDAIKDCTDASGACYQDNEKRTATAVEELSKRIDRNFVAFCEHSASLSCSTTTTTTAR